MNRTFAIGDIHGDAGALFRLVATFPELDETDTIVFVGDYLDRGSQSKEVVAFVRDLPSQVAARVVVDRGWPEFSLPPGNGCLATMRSFKDAVQPEDGEGIATDELQELLKGSFFPEDVVAWMRELPHYYEDERAIYVHAGLPRQGNEFPHPRDTKNSTALLWCRDESFFRLYRGKLVVFGHTSTELLPPELSSYTPEDPTDIWAGPCTIGLDTGAGKGGWLTGLELPSLRVYESR